MSSATGQVGSRMKEDMTHALSACTYIIRDKNAGDSISLREFTSGSSSYRRNHSNVTNQVVNLCHCGIDHFGNIDSSLEEQRTGFLFARLCLCWGIIESKSASTKTSSGSGWIKLDGGSIACTTESEIAFVADFSDRISASISAWSILYEQYKQRRPS